MRLLPLPAALLAVTAYNVSAADAEPAELLPKVTVHAEQTGDYRARRAISATKIEAELRDVPQTINVVPAALLRDQHATSIQDALKNVPGVGFSTGDGQRDQVSIRGFTAIADQFVDGIRDDALYFRDLSNIERIEVIKGPASVLYGRGSSGGLINRITKQPGIDIGEVSLSYGTWADRRAELDIGHRFGDSDNAWRLTGATEDADSYRDPQFLKRRTIAPSLLLNPSQDTTLLLQADYLQDRRVTDFGIPAFRGRPVDVPVGTYYGAANARNVDTSESKVTSTTATLSHTFNDHLSLRNTLRWYDYTLDRNNTLPGSVNEQAKTVTLNRSNVLRDEHGWFNQTELNQRFAVGAIAHDFLYGMELGRQDKSLLNRSANGVAVVDLFHPQLPVLPLTVTLPPSANNLGRFDTTAVYVQDMLSWGEHWKALVGIRYDRFKQATENRLPGQPNLSRTDSAPSPRAGLVWQPSAAQSYYLSWSRSFQPSGEAFALAANNADIAPEHTRNTELGAKYDLFEGRASFTASLFQLERDGIKTTDPLTQKVLPIGEQRTRGVELSGAADLADGWRLLAGYAYLDARITHSIAMDSGQPIQGKRATLTPRHSGNVWVTHSFAEHWQFGGGLNLVGARQANPGNTVTLPGYVTADLMAQYYAGPLSLQLNLTNLTNARYIVSGHGSSPNLNLPGAPRGASLTARYSF
ncbi:MAG: TonB-dependent siderophore receptor [Rudaea sp.]|uniref:TonB-dependent receptor n=1 Tax=unclassified Rudaea TaxID=2627037 RepID=UPI0010F99475|nr:MULTISPECIES: TonB-dependent siderophore receptor [unclassified Rudaea]MBN8885108.1 TonB-dependent siderophore receptor [Rudaea sp.]MBR0344787.1 TonB-dependent siderophore receptor [Rudaea sp.]